MAAESIRTAADVVSKPKNKGNSANFILNRELIIPVYDADQSPYDDFYFTAVDLSLQIE